MKSLLLYVVIGILGISCRHSAYEFNPVIKDFEENTKGISGFYFYPGTIKMLNLKKDSAFTNLFKEVKRIKVQTLHQS